jgi:hypothetical protein
MAFKILIVANQTAASDDLLDALRQHAERGPTHFALLVPASPTAEPDQARETVETALSRMRDAGLDVEGTVGFGDPFEVVAETWDPRKFDEVIVSTLPGQTSKWMQSDLPHRIARMTGVQVTHVVTREQREPLVEPPPAHEKHGVLSPLSVLTWGGKLARRRSA